jgi:hypothetical protein
MLYTITARGMKKVIQIRTFAGMVLWANDPKWQWTIGISTERLISWVEKTKIKPFCTPLKWKVSE